MGIEADTETLQKREIQVRSLTGESIILTVEASDTVQELKLLLKNIFPPASTSPNFHLFLKVTSILITQCVCADILLVILYVQ